MDNGAEDIGRFIGLEQRRAGKGDIGRIGQGLAHTLMRFPAMTAVAFIYQNNEVGARVSTRRLPGRGSQTC